jgi:hydroxymethylpyrimidine pyrophosphatase-like HAD family hydrolase
MGQSEHEVHLIARRVTSSNEEDGFADAVERLILRANDTATQTAERS